MAAENPTWGEERIADELLLKLGLPVSPRTVGKYLNNSPAREDHGISVGPHSCATMLTLLWPATSLFGLLLVSVSFMYLWPWRSDLAHPSLQRHRAPYRRVDAPATARDTPRRSQRSLRSHDRQGCFSAELDDQIQHLHVRVLRSPVRAPTANAHCERLIGSMRIEHNI
jgi:putative transposase